MGGHELVLDSDSVDDLNSFLRKKSFLLTFSGSVESYLLRISLQFIVHAHEEVLDVTVVFLLLVDGRESVSAKSRSVLLGKHSAREATETHGGSD